LSPRDHSRPRLRQRACNRGTSATGEVTAPRSCRRGQGTRDADDANPHGDSFYICLDLSGIDVGSIDLTVEQNVLTVRAERARCGPTAPR